MRHGPKVLVGRSVTVRITGAEPSYFDDVHRAHIGQSGVVHAVVRSEPRDNPLVKVKFPPDDRIVFYRLAELVVLES